MGNVAYDLNYQRNTVPVPDGDSPIPSSPSAETDPQRMKLRAAG